MKKNGSTQANAKRGEEDGEEDVPHALLGVERADFDHPLAVFGGGLFGRAELDVLLDELDRRVGAGNDGLRRGAAEPVDDRAARNQPEQKRRVHEREVVHVLRSGRR